MTKKEFIFCILAAIFAFLFAMQSIKVKYIKTNQTDTIYRTSERLKLDTLRIKAPPKETIIWKTDTLLRDTIIHDTLILGVRSNGRKLEVDRIAPLGLVQTDTYKLPFWSKYAINTKGNVRIKKHTFAKVAISAVALGIISFVVYKNIQ